MPQRRVMMTILLLFVVAAAWFSFSAAYPVPELRVGMTRHEVETVLGKPETHIDEGDGGVGVYQAVPNWLLGRRAVYVVTYDSSNRVAHYDLAESSFGNTRQTHR